MQNEYDNVNKLRDGIKKLMDIRAIRSCTIDHGYKAEDIIAECVCGQKHLMWKTEVSVQYETKPGYHYVRNKTGEPYYERNDWQRVKNVEAYITNINKILIMLQQGFSFDQVSDWCILCDKEVLFQEEGIDPLGFNGYRIRSKSER